MTALTEYDRLESQGLWRPAPEAQRRDVVVSVGEATLIIQDAREVALAHWSLPAVERLNPGEMPARYAPGAEAPEELEIADPQMIEAIERVRRVLDRQRPHHGRLRLGLIAGVCLAVLALAVFWLPGALTRYTAAIVPDVGRAAIARDLLTEMRGIGGAPCQSPEAAVALERLHERLLGEAPGRLLVLPGGIAGSAHLPDGTILLARELVEDYDAPDVAAGYVLAEAARMDANDPMRALLREIGLGAALRLSTSGTLPPRAVERQARAMAARAPAAPPPAADLLPRFADAGVPTAPYAYAVDITGETTLPLIEADPVARGAARLILSDSDWVALQNVCGD